MKHILMFVAVMVLVGAVFGRAAHHTTHTVQQQLSQQQQVLKDL